MSRDKLVQAQEVRAKAALILPPPRRVWLGFAKNLWALVFQAFFSGPRSLVLHAARAKGDFSKKTGIFVRRMTTDAPKTHGGGGAALALTSIMYRVKN